MWSYVLLLLCGSLWTVTDSTKIGAFNIQTFGRSKMSKSHVVEILVEIVRRYDILLIQEIRDATGTAIETLLEKVNGNGDYQYRMVIGERVGRTSYKEQYAFFYKTNTGITLEDTFSYDDGDESRGDDTFEREPFVARFHLPNGAVSDIALVAIHVKPSQAVDEINRLVDVHQYTRQHWLMENILILGDLNADCSYVDDSEWSSIRLKTDSTFNWLIGDDADTTVSRTHCAYDRFVASGHQLSQGVVPGSVHTYRFDDELRLSYDQAREVSDHYPIEMELD